ncbi:uncharacterized protein LOC110977327 [Acanthaster planci]|uniref:Uncharacterized protein LOC110977327 n=1 Tax=Acanthaster planci TaxID=133434 RepID=A0A8B7Y3C0_ACAPL|nr:uncharacterized protein LOC110977327 [Acanthaster planci]XP_022087023.1 uncharacterized protein LOC110977327 [Acanthaster planci]
MPAKNASFVMASLALLSLGFNLYRRVFTANEMLRCTKDLQMTRRNSIIVRERLVRTAAMLTELNRTIAGLGEPNGPAADRSALGGKLWPSENEDLVVRISAMKRENDKAKVYLVKLQEDLKGTEKEASLAILNGGKLTDEINDLREEFKRLKRQLKAAVRKDIS